MKEFLLTCSINDDPRLECDLTGPGYTLDSQTRIKLESKDEMKKRGVDSPDDGDALAVTFARNVAPRVATPQPLRRHVAKGIRWA